MLLLNNVPVNTLKHAVINGERKAIYKDPITAGGNANKKSAKGLLSVQFNFDIMNFELKENCTEEEEELGFLYTVFENGLLTNPTNLREIRANLIK